MVSQLLCQDVDGKEGGSNDGANNSVDAWNGNGGIVGHGGAVTPVACFQVEEQQHNDTTTVWRMI